MRFRSTRDLRAVGEIVGVDRLRLLGPANAPVCRVIEQVRERRIGARHPASTGRDAVGTRNRFCRRHTLVVKRTARVVEDIRSGHGTQQRTVPSAAHFILRRRASRGVGEIALIAGGAIERREGVGEHLARDGGRATWLHDLGLTDHARYGKSLLEICARHDVVATIGRVKALESGALSAFCIFSGTDVEIALVESAADAI